MQKDEPEIVANNHLTSSEEKSQQPSTNSISPLRFPDFLCIGTQKGGTTTLHRLLSNHPGVMLPPQKELHYFTRHYNKGSHWYAQAFSAASPEQRCGEITPYYLFHPEVPGRVQALMPQVRIIVLLRDPVERALSQYFHSRRLGMEPLDLLSALHAEPQRLYGAEGILAQAGGRHRSHQEHSYVARSRYEQQLPRWEQWFFGHQQLLVLRSEDLFRTPEVIWQQLLQFLELEPWPLPALPRAANAGRGEAQRVPQAIRARLEQTLQGTYAWVQGRYGWGWPRH